MSANSYIWVRSIAKVRLRVNFTQILVILAQVALRIVFFNLVFAALLSVLPDNLAKVQSVIYREHQVLILIALSLNFPTHLISRSF